MLDSETISSSNVATSKFGLFKDKYQKLIIIQQADTFTRYRPTFKW